MAVVLLTDSGMKNAHASFRALAALLAGVALLSGLSFSAAAAPPQAYVVVDATSGRALLESDADVLAHPASLTKMMTLYLLFDALNSGRLKLNSTIRFSKNAARQPPSDLGVRPGGSITVKTAILALAVKSANDVAVAVAERLAGSEEKFAAQMNAKARALGMARTNFVNPSGLHDPEQISTPRDLARLARGLYFKHKRYYKYFGEARFSHGRRTIRTHNHFVSKYPNADGIKTGYINASGFNLAGSAVRDGRRLIGVIVGGESPAQRDLDLMGIMDAGFRVASGLGKPRYAGIAPVAVDFGTGAPALPPRRPGGGPPPAGAIAMATAAMATPGAMPVSIAGSASGPAVYSAQVGAVGSAKAAAQLATKRLEDLGLNAAGATPYVAALKLRSGARLYRARIGGLTDDQAAAACSTLKQSGRDCLVVAPDRSG